MREKNSDSERHSKGRPAARRAPRHGVEKSPRAIGAELRKKRGPVFGVGMMKWAVSGPRSSHQHGNDGKKIEKEGTKSRVTRKP